MKRLSIYPVTRLHLTILLPHITAGQVITGTFAGLGVALEAVIVWAMTRDDPAKELVSSQ